MAGLLDGDLKVPRSYLFEDCFVLLTLRIPFLQVSPKFLQKQHCSVKFAVHIFLSFVIGYLKQSSGLSLRTLATAKTLASPGLGRSIPQVILYRTPGDISALCAIWYAGIPAVLIFLINFWLIIVFASMKIINKLHTPHIYILCFWRSKCNIRIISNNYKKKFFLF